MAIITGQLIQQERQIYSENLLSESSAYNEDKVFTITSGTGTAVISDDISYEGGKCLKVNWTDMLNPLYFNSATDTTTVVEDGNYVFAHRIYTISLNPSLPPSVFYKIKVLKNAVLLHTMECYTDANPQPLYVDNVWNCFGQSFNLSAGDILSWTYEIISGQDLLGDVTLYYDGWKLELDDRSIGIPSMYSKTPSTFAKSTDLHVTETQWDVTDVGAQVVADGADLNLLTLIDNVADKNTENTDAYDELDIVSNVIKTTWRGSKIIHTIMVEFNILIGADQFYQIQIRRAVDNSVVSRYQVQRNADDTIQTIEMTSRTLSNTDPFTIDGFYIAFVNNSGAGATIDDGLSVVIINSYQKGQPQ